MPMSTSRCLPVFAALALLAMVAPAGDAGVTYPDHVRLLAARTADGREIAINTPDAWAARRRHIIEAMQKVMGGPLPGADKKVAPDPKISDDADLVEIRRTKMTIAVEAGDRLPVFLFVPKAKSSKLPAVVCLHPTNRQLGKGVVAGLGNDPNMAYAVELAKRGYVTLAPDYVGMGEYHLDPYAQGYASATMKGVWNHMRCIDYLASLPEVDAGHVGAMGHSLGGHNSMFLGVFDERVKCVVSNCGFCSFPCYMKGDLAGWSHDGYMPRIRSTYGCDPAKMPFDFTEVVAALAPRPFLACAPVGDANFDVQGVRDCIAAAEPVYELLGAKDRLRAIYPVAGHEFPPAARQAAYESLD